MKIAACFGFKTMEPDFNTCWQWSRLNVQHLVRGDMYDRNNPARLSLSDRRTIRVTITNTRAYDSPLVIRSHGRVRYETSAWKLELLVQRNSKAKTVSLGSFSGDVEVFTRDTLTAKMLGLFEA